MVKSMTGYGRYESVSESRKVTFEIKSVNHRYADINIKLPRAYTFLEDDIRSKVLAGVSRGKIDVYLSIENYAGLTQSIVVDKELAKAYYDAICQVSEATGTEPCNSASKIASFPDVLIPRRETVDEDSMRAEILPVLEKALDEFIKMRQREGARLAESLCKSVDYIFETTLQIEAYMPETVKEYRENLTQKITEFLQNSDVDENRILTEVAIFSDKICTDEEVVRLKSHCDEFKQILKSDKPIGRRLDSLLQEMNREINTIGSKSTKLEVLNLVIEVKCELEKLREQSQNIE